MIDPRCPELEAYIASLTSTWEQAVAMRTLAAAFPYLKSCDDWMDRIAVLEGTLRLKIADKADLLALAAGLAEDLMAQTWAAPRARGPVPAIAER